MRDKLGRGVIRLGDPTDHGGKVTTSFDELRVLGLPVAGEGSLAWCPRCSGEFRLLPGAACRHHGKAIAFDGDPTACGARLISTVKAH